MDYKRLDDAKKVYERLLLELSVREDNEHVGTGLGGNPSELFFLLSHNVKIAATAPLNDKIHFGQAGATEILVEIPEKPNMKLMRNELTKFIASHPDKQDVTREQLLNPSFLKDQTNKTLNIQLLIKALEQTKILVDWLDLKIELQDQVHATFRKEYTDIETSFLKEMNLPETYFDDTEEDDDDPIDRMMRAHPVWGLKYKEAQTRQTEINDRLLSKDDLNKIEFVGTFPSFIALFAIRSLVGIERMVHLNLDERTECKFLNSINKKLND